MTIVARGRAVATGLTVAASVVLIALAANPAAASAAPESTESRTTSIRIWVSNMKPSDSESIPGAECPAEYPYLLNEQKSSPLRGVAPGIEVIDPNNAITVTGYDVKTQNIENYAVAVGWEGGIATNWWALDSRLLVIDMHCTNDLSLAKKTPFGHS